MDQVLHGGGKEGLSMGKERVAGIPGALPDPSGTPLITGGPLSGGRDKEKTGENSQRRLTAGHRTHNGPFPARVYVKLEKDDLLPCPAAGYTTGNRDRKGRAHECCLHVRAPVTIAPLCVMGVVFVVGRKNTERTAEIRKHPGLVLDRGQRRSRVLHKQVKKALVYPALAHCLSHLRRDIKDITLAPGGNVDDLPEQQVSPSLFLLMVMP